MVLQIRKATGPSNVAISLTSTESVARLCGGRLLVPAADAAVVLGYRSTNALREQIRRGTLQIPVIRRGQDILIAASSISEYINSAQQAAVQFIEDQPKPDPETVELLKKRGQEIAATLVFRQPDDVVREIATKIAKQRKKRIAKLPPEPPPTGGLDW